MGVSQGGLLGGSYSWCNRTRVQRAPGEGLGRESADAGLALSQGFISDFLVPVVSRTAPSKQ